MISKHLDRRRAKFDHDLRLVKTSVHCGIISPSLTALLLITVQWVCLLGYGGRVCLIHLGYSGRVFLGTVGVSTWSTWGTVGVSSWVWWACLLDPLGVQWACLLRYGGHVYLSCWDTVSMSTWALGVQWARLLWYLGYSGQWACLGVQWACLLGPLGVQWACLLVYSRCVFLVCFCSKCLSLLIIVDWFAQFSEEISITDYQSQVNTATILV